MRRKWRSHDNVCQNATIRDRCDAISASTLSGGDPLFRRVFLGASASLPLLTVADRAIAADPAPQSTPFDGATVRNMARQLALQPYKAPDSTLPAPFKNLDFDAYRGIRFDPAKVAVARPGPEVHRAVLPSRLHLPGPGRHLRGGRRQGGADPLQPRPVHASKRCRRARGDLGFAGFRIHYPLNHPDPFGRGVRVPGRQLFPCGRRRARDTGCPRAGWRSRRPIPAGEEFPVFRSFWLERPAPGADIIVIHALLDSPSATAAFRFTIRPGEERSSTPKPRPIRASTSLRPGWRR